MMTRSDAAAAETAPPAPLNAGQIYDFLDQGYVLVSGLISADLAAAADLAAFRANGFSPTDPATWVNPPKGEFFRDPELLAVYTPALMAAVAQLASDNPNRFATAQPPRDAFVIKLLPQPGPWQVVDPHVDFPAGGHLECFPPHWHMLTMIYLHDIEPHGGGTVLYPKSHRRIEALMRSDPLRYWLFEEVREDFDKIDFGEPLEVAPRAGDVLFLHAGMRHCKPMNTGSRPRFAMHWKW